MLRAEYDLETFAKEQKADPEDDVIVEQSRRQTRTSQPYYSPEYVDSVRRFDRWVKRIENFKYRMSLCVLYCKQNKLKGNHLLNLPENHNLTFSDTFCHHVSRHHL